MTNKILNFEDRLIQKECENPISEKEQINYTMSSSMNLALSVIAKYQDLDDNKIHLESFNISMQSLIVFNDYDQLDYIINNKVYKFDYSYGDKSKITHEGKIKLTLGNPYFYNLLLEKYKFSLNKSIDFIYRFYIQSFLDTFNDLENGPRINFSSKLDVKKRAMSSLDNVLFEILEYDHIVGFRKNSIIGIKNDIDKTEDKIDTF